MNIRAFIWRLFKSDSKVVSVKENIVLFLMVLAAWFISFTFLVPFLFLMMVSSTVRKLLHQWNMQYKKEGIDELTRRLFCILRDSCPQFDFRKLHILELGEISSFSFEEYSEQHEIDIVGDNPELRRKLDGVNKNICICSEKDMLKNCKEDTYDVIISTFFLCSVKNSKTILADIRRILKPGGKFAFLEHCGFPENELSHKFQRMITPLWEIVFGCRLSHHPSHLLFQSSFHSLNYHTYYNQNRLVLYRPIIVGVCTK